MTVPNSELSPKMKETLKQNSCNSLRFTEPTVWRQNYFTFI